MLVEKILQKIHGVGSLGIGSDAQGVTKFYPCVGLPQKEIIKIEEDYKRIGINNTFILYSDGSLFVAEENKKLKKLI